MNTTELLQQLNERGIEIWANQDKIGIRSPKGAMTPQLRAQLAASKAELLDFLSRSDSPSPACDPSSDCCSLSTLGRLIGGWGNNPSPSLRSPVIDPNLMAERLKVTFRPLPKGYDNTSVLNFREALEKKLRAFGVNIVPWQEATRQFSYKINLPLLTWKPKVKTRAVKVGINAVIDVERPPSLACAIKNWIAECSYRGLTRWVWKEKKPSITRIAKTIGWAEEHAAKYIEDPTNTQVIILSPLDDRLADPDLAYQQKIGIGINKLVKTFSEIIIGVSDKKISILNMNLSDSSFSRSEIERFVAKSLIPKIFVPIAPLLLNRFQLGTYNPENSIFAAKLQDLGHKLADTGLFPPGFRLKEVIPRQSHRDIVDIIVNGRTGVSYGFIAYVEPPQYFGEREIDEREWQDLSPVPGFNGEEIRQANSGRRYLKTRLGAEYAYRQIPDLWIVSARSGSNKTALNLATDILRIGLTDRLCLQLPSGIQGETADIKPSYDIYVMVAIALSCALYAPSLVENGMPIVHFHGYPAREWFRGDEYCIGSQNPSVPCGTYESGVFNFLGIYELARQYGDRIDLASLIEPDHGTNIIAADPDYLIQRLKEGVENQQIELGGRHFASLKDRPLRSCLANV